VVCVYMVGISTVFGEVYVVYVVFVYDMCDVYDEYVQYGVCCM